MNLRLEKFSSLVRKQLAPILREYQKPGVTISVNSIKISPDLKVAHVYIGIFGQSRNEVFTSIERERGQISSRLAQKIKAKFSPSLRFHLDDGQTEYEHIDELLKTS